ncbi:MAG TPA: DUF2092 domain-containing protein [Myxococcota bacterium]|nr:DUF2092 domain-containing protein [Myxococcota bacterium]
MRRRGGARAALLLAATWLLVTASRADETPGASSLDALLPLPAPAPAEIAPPPTLSAVEPQAMAALKRMLDALVYAQALHVRVESEYDAVRESGETLSFSRASEITLRRPDRLRIESSEGAGAQRVLGYDGRYLTLYDARENLFAAVERESDLDGVLAFVRDDVGMDLPVAPLFSSGIRSLLLEGVTSAAWIGRETFDGAPHDHVALRYGDVGLQLWIAGEGDPLPRRLTLTFEGARGRPQLHADFREWDLAPKVTEWVFAFDPPDGVRAVPFVLAKNGHEPPRSEPERGPAAGGLVSLERAKRAQQTAAAVAAARDTAERLERAAGRPQSGRAVRRGSTPPAPNPESPDADPVAVPETNAIDRPLGTVLSAGELERLSQQAGCARAQTEYAGARYSRCGGTWYVEALAGGELRYVAVEAPPGAPTN